MSTTTVPSFRFMPYPDTDDTPNVVVDGSPNAATVLTLTHWPGYIQPPSLETDLSAQMAFQYLDQPIEHPPADVVTNNHFDQDGLVSTFALTQPETAMQHRRLLIDIAAAGDFAVYRDRTAARVSMALWSFSDPVRSPIASQLAGRSYPEQCGILYDAALPMLIDLATDADRHRDLWDAEDADLRASEDAIADGAITIREHPDVDLAVVTIADELPARSGHRFAGGDTFDLVHPMAVNNATRCVRLLVVHGRRYQYTDRYETWVQYRTRRPPARVDLAPLAERLTELESGATAWTADPPSALTPTMTADTESSLAPHTMVDEVVRHLSVSPPAWDPYSARE